MAKKVAGARLGNLRNLAHAGNIGRTALIDVADEFASGLLPGDPGNPRYRRAHVGIDGYGAKPARNKICPWRQLATIIRAKFAGAHRIIGLISLFIAGNFLPLHAPHRRAPTALLRHAAALTMSIRTILNGAMSHPLKNLWA